MRRITLITASIAATWMLVISFVTARMIEPLIFSCILGALWLCPNGKEPIAKAQFAAILLVASVGLLGYYTYLVLTSKDGAYRPV